ncbi:MAG TPA: SAVED domain-containing protein [Thermoanaerobaculia bacterium]|nr:SAVED domain-containing protein [Thermoanaerobaculia bacterium]
MPGNEVFEDVVLEIRSVADCRFQVRLETAARGEVTADFIPPFDPGAPGPEWNGVVRELDVSPRERTRTEASARDLGSELFTALLPAELRRLFDPKRAWLDEEDPEGRDRRLRLRLRLDLQDEAVRPLAALPWELLYDPDFKNFYGHGRRRLLVRQLASPLEAAPLAVTPPLRILPVAPSPRGATPLELATEVRGLQDALGRESRITLLPLAGPTLDETLRALERERPHVLHFMGHGSFDVAKGEGHLLFEDGAGGAGPVAGELLAELLEDSPAARRHLRLVVLNACRTAEMPRSPAQSPWAAVGAALSLRGFPAVVAMQFPIADANAIRFSSVFYVALADGEPVDVATSEGRRALYVLDRHSTQWATPVLFLRARDGRLFGLPRQDEPTATPRLPAEPTPPRVVNPLLLGIRSREPWGNRPANTLDLRGAFVDREIRDPALWQTEILPKLKEFLHHAAADRRPLVLDFAAHASIAFAAGWVLEAKSGLDVTIIQRQQGRPDQPWNPDDEPLPEGPFWQAEDDLLLDETAADVAVAVGITWDVLADVHAYLARERLPIRSIVRATLSPKPSASGVKSGAHCLALAQSLAQRIRTHTQQETPGTLHLFIAGPNVFPFYLGQLARGLGRIQMYEYAYGTSQPGAYKPSIALP